VVVVVPVMEIRTVNVSHALVMTRTPSDSILQRFGVVVSVSGQPDICVYGTPFTHGLACR
jgi:hypothetical protein